MRVYFQANLGIIAVLAFEATIPLQASEVAFNLLDSHDTPRLLTLAKGDKKKFKTRCIVPMHLYRHTMHLLW